LIFRSLANRNKILYQTSWHDWRLDKTPRQPKPNYIKRWLQKQWHTFVRHPNVNVIAVTPTVADTVLQQTGVSATIIPHAVPEVFFKAGSERKPKKNKSLKLLYVGEISEKKGIKVLLNMLKELNCDDISLTVVGNGPLVTLVKGSAHNVTYLGPIYDRSKLATVMSQHDVLMLLSQKTPTWEELFGIVIVEAIAAGCVVIASDHIGPVGILGKEASNGVYSESDIENVKLKLKRLLKESSSLECLRQKQKVANDFATASVKEKWREVMILS
jgi:glycosyltransferase involved in cell wall biosynthesis